MLGLCLYVPVSNSDSVEVEYFESNGLPSELKSLFNKLSVFLPSQEFSTYQKWRKVREKSLYVNRLGHFVGRGTGCVAITTNLPTFEIQLVHSNSGEPPPQGDRRN